ncbi:hypothetical protein [Flavobacterium sp.]|uniref:hypothetical protein n=1 Tax=Flavobacterium sp. TaxID=239 RepID=UPI00262D38B4|nr:hypothetical protein [Flavobacterium sp.]
MIKPIIAFICILFLSVSCYAQDGGLTVGYGYRMNYRIAGLDQFSGVKPIGSPYLNVMFSPAMVDGIPAKVNMRYNACFDAMEFISPKNDTLALDKIPDFSNITFLSANKKYKLVTYNNAEKSHQGYLIELYQKANYTLFKREWISFYPGKKAKTSLERDMPARFSKENDQYYLKDTNGYITDFPESKKQLAKLFPDKKEAIEKFVKENKIDFETDRTKIIDFLAQ